MSKQKSNDSHKLKDAIKQYTKRSGRRAIPDAERRVHCVSVRLNDNELLWLDFVRGQVGLQRGEYLRFAALSTLPPVIPPVNQEAFRLLSRVSANLNQLAKRLNQDHYSIAITEIESAIQETKRAIIGANINESKNNKRVES